MVLQQASLSAAHLALASTGQQRLHTQRAPDIFSYPLLLLPLTRTIDAHVLIDDNVGYAMDCADAGINVLLYDWEDSYPWSKLPEGCAAGRVAGDCACSQCM